MVDITPDARPIHRSPLLGSDSVDFGLRQLRIFGNFLPDLQVIPHGSPVQSWCRIPWWGGSGLSPTQAFRARVLAFAGRDLPYFTRAFLQDGQFYYFISIVSGAAALALVLNKSVYPLYRPLLAPIHPVLLNITAGHVFREVKLGRMRERELTLAFQQSKIEETLSLRSIPHDEEAREGPS
ncbi:hypothetical protein BDP27DRAFT_305605 [Rhodocollybia butyracea]|uniref:Uncharacterized protein n=1 Tax=Rhodocollybia butyracea TaxID=206335 RepID=A0A9P5PF02_9AGAR|nr:hypothetical protein BDP27DRAFT_305605 [Rhodocollybia butyracea]